ncbi:MAG TPA: oligosaccharide flippase family protein [Acidobacteriaceae bacterium]|nr:oligosaccharide flippase family protein [Acidobacteriaceae bacterium]
MQLRIWHIARSVMSNWFATVATLIVGFFLAPFIVHRLGNLAYGVWVLAISSVNYMGLLDLGMASSVIRFVSKGYTTKDHTLASEALSAVLWVRMQISGVIVLFTALLAVVFPHMFKVPAELVHDARVALLLIGISTTISMSFGVFSSTLSALHRYDLRSIVTLTELTIRAGGVVLVLRSGHGIVAIACCELLTAIVGKSLLAYLARKAYPELRIGLNRPAKDVLRRIWSYSMYAFLITIGVQIVYQTDNLVVGAFVSATAVTFYSIGNSLCRYTEQMVTAMTTTFTPAASSYEAAGDVYSLRSLYFNGTRATMAITLPVTVTLIIRGGSFIAVWMGPQYSHISGTVLAILAIALTFSLQNSTAVAIAFGVEKHKMLAKWTLAEAFANLTLSVILAHRIGLYGVAIGTLVPSLAIQLLLWPRYVSRVVDVTLPQVLWNTWGPMFVCIAPFAAASYAVDIYFPAGTKLEFFLQTFALLPIFAAMIALVFRDNVRRQILPRVRSYLYARSV